MVVNTTAVDLGLGTGGWHFVHWNLRAASGSSPGPGHIMKLRYTSLQADVGSTEEHLDPAVGAAPTPPGCRWSRRRCTASCPQSPSGSARARPDARIAYVMTDGAALPLALSDLVATLRDRGLVDTTITCGHTFGGDHEAVNVYSALDDRPARRRAPTSPSWRWAPASSGPAPRSGSPASRSGTVLDATVGLGGVPVACLRASAADGRDRHQGISHHTATTLPSARRSRVTVPVPALGASVEADLHADLGDRRHRGAARRGDGRHPRRARGASPPTTCGSARWAGRRRTTRSSSSAPPQPGSRRSLP